LSWQFPAALWERTKGDPDALEKYFQDNVEWLRPTRTKLVGESRESDGTMRKYDYEQDVLDADPTLADAAVSNRKPEFLDFYAELLAARGPDDATVKELADHYLPKEAPRAEEDFAKWLASVRERLYFSDVCGYRWFVAPPELAKKPAAAAVNGAGSE
jgi:hypothetical protein